MADRGVTMSMWLLIVEQVQSAALRSGWRISSSAAAAALAM